ncbi:MAG TPA: hypothetical protein PLM12_11605, partial [Comamonas denitrificans]|nr:hypothetical protein [Comamonas denitrificans]
QLGKTEFGTGSVTGITEAPKTAAANDMTNADVTIVITGANQVSAQVTIAKDADVTGDEALGRVVQAINSKTADTGIVAFLAEDGKSIQYRAEKNADGVLASATMAVSGGGATGVAAL